MSEITITFTIDWIIFLHPLSSSIELQISTFNIWVQVIIRNVVFSQKANVRKIFRISVDNLLQPRFGIVLDGFKPFARLELNQSSTLRRLREKTNINALGMVYSVLSIFSIQGLRFPWISACQRKRSQLCVVHVSESLLRGTALCQTASIAWLTVILSLEEGLVALERVSHFISRLRG